MAAAPGLVAARPKAPQAPAQDVQTPGGLVVPFIRGSGLGRYKFFEKAGVTLLTTTQDLGPIPVKAYDYMRSILVKVTATAAGAGSAVTLAEDAPFNFFTTVKVDQPNGQTMYSVTSGYSAAMIHKYGGYAFNSDPRSLNDFVVTTGSGTAPSCTFSFRIPFELNIRDGLGSLPNKDANAPFNLYLTVNTLANVFGGTPTTPTFKVQCFLEAWDQPPTMLDGEPVQTTPPNMNTLQRWTEQPITVSSGSFDARIRKLGNYVRMIIPILRRSASTRANGDADWPDPLAIVLDEDVKDNITRSMWLQDIWEKWGYGPVNVGSATTAADGSMGHDNGVFPYDYCHEFDGQVGHETGDLYLPTIESEDYILRGSYGNAGTITMLVNEVLPQGNIFT